jgi:ATP/maltotriose-dependent transcriptional regulator MalT
LVEAARELLDEGRTLIEPLQEAQFTGPIFVGLVEVALMQSALDEASSLAAEGVERLRRTEDHYYVAEVLAMAARAEAERAETARARRDQAVAERAATAAARYSETLRELAGATGDGDTYGGWIAAAAAVGAAEARRASSGADPAAWGTAVAASQTASPWLLAYARFRLGEALLAGHGSRRDAETALSTAFACAGQLSATPLVGWIEAVARRARISLEASAAPAGPSDDAEPVPAPDDLGLTTREREVLTLVAEGYTNRRIAERLFISESTAGVHVSNILGKLGVASRTEAAAVAARLGIGA